MPLHDRILKGTEILSTSVSKSTHMGVGSIAGSRTASPDLMVTFWGLTFVRDNFIRMFIYHEVELIAQKRRCARGGRGSTVGEVVSVVSQTGDEGSDDCVYSRCRVASSNSSFISSPVIICLTGR